MGDSLYEVLHESETHVDMVRLAELCLGGTVPDKLRGDTWKYLLGVSRPEKTEEISLVKRMAHEYQELERPWALCLDEDVIRRVEMDVRRYYRASGLERSREMSASTRVQIKQVILRYLNFHPCDYDRSLLHLIGPLVHVYASERELYYSFEALVGRLAPRFTQEGGRELVVTFNTLFRQALPDLYAYFEEEAVSVHQWLPSWLRSLLARELPMPCVLRLWDIYFAHEQQAAREDAPLELHLYVCLAILQLCMEDLLELDYSEIRWYLQHLPSMDINHVLMTARNIRDDSNLLW